MQTKIHVFDKWKENDAAFESRVNAWIETVGDTALVSINENLRNGDIVFVFTFSQKKSIEQELCLIAGPELKDLESVVNNALLGLEEAGRRATHIHFLTTAKSARAAAAFLVEGNRSLPDLGPEVSTDDAGQRQSPEETKQDPDSNAKPKRRAKKPSVA